jgi:hypothetical protein
VDTSRAGRLLGVRETFRGRVIGPGDPGYDEARTVFYGGFDRRPAVGIRVADATDVARVVQLARDTGLELAVRSGGHSPAGHSVTDGGIALDLGSPKKPTASSSSWRFWLTRETQKRESVPSRRSVPCRHR